MSTNDDRRAIERFVAGLPVDASDLATAITARAVDRTIVIQALLNGLSSPEPVVRLRAAERVAEMPDVAPPVAARLALIAATDEDRRAREASAAALRAHGLAVPDEADPPPKRWSFGLPLHLAVSFARDPEAEIEITAESLAARDLHGLLRRDAAGAVWLDLAQLPEELIATRPTLRVRKDGPEARLVPLARAETPVSAGGDVTIRVPPAVGTFDAVAGWLRHGAALDV